MKNSILLVIVSLLFLSAIEAQSTDVHPAAEETIQPSQTSPATSNSPSALLEVKIPAGTSIEVEAAYTVNSIDVKPGERISFRVLVPVIIDGVTVIEKDALITARLTQAKRGGHWGKAGRLAWSMEDVIGADNSRITLALETTSRGDKLWSLEAKGEHSENIKGQGSVKGTSHTGEVAARMIVTGALFPPLALLNGFKRGENAVLSEGRRFVVYVGKDSTVKTNATP
jgi:hypothetical protein